MKCPGERSISCGECTSIFNGAYVDGAMSLNRDLSYRDAQVLAENSPQAKLLAERANLDRSCAERQRRADMLGKRAARGEAYITDDDRE